MKMPGAKYVIPAETLTSTITALEFAQNRYEQDALTLLAASFRTSERDTACSASCQTLGLERMARAVETARLVDFYLQL